jgi:hypothetical protein
MINSGSGQAQVPLWRLGYLLHCRHARLVVASRDRVRPVGPRWIALTALRAAVILRISRGDTQESETESESNISVRRGCWLRFLGRLVLE